jgi:DNA-binding protein H-NS
MSKKQRQNAKKREAEKAAKSEAEVQRQAVLKQHQRDVEKARMASQSKGGKVTSGGMKATVSENGKLVWE